LSYGRKLLSRKTLRTQDHLGWNGYNTYYHTSTPGVRLHEKDYTADLQQWNSLRAAFLQLKSKSC